MFSLLAANGFLAIRQLLGLRFSKYIQFDSFLLSICSGASILTITSSKLLHLKSVIENIYIYSVRMSLCVVNITESADRGMTRWRTNSPVLQTIILCFVVFCGPGMNTAILTLGAGGSHPSNIPVVDKISIVQGVLMIVASIFGGSINNQLGPRFTVMVGASGYPIYIGALWWLDQGRLPIFAFIIAAYHGICSGLFYTATGYIVTSYSSEQHRGKYIASVSSSLGIGSAVGSGIVLGLTVHSSEKSAHVPSTVYLSIIAIQIIGFLIAALIQNPTKVRRNNGQAIAHFISTAWRDELHALPKSIMTPSVLLMSLGFFGCQMPLSLLGSLNAFYFNIRTRALINFCFWMSSAGASALFGLICDSKDFGNRRKRAIIASSITAALVLGTNSGFLSFLCTHSIDRYRAPPGMDWNDGSVFSRLLVPYIFLGFTSYVFQNYLLWLLGTLTNQPAVLSRYSGYIEALKALGLIVAFEIDSNRTPFLVEAASYFSINAVGIMLCIISAIYYTTDTKYGEEESVIVPREFLAEVFVHNGN